MIGPSPVQEIRDAVRSRARSAVEVCRDALARIAAANPQLNAFNTVTAERALERADGHRSASRSLAGRAADRRARGRQGQPVHGRPSDDRLVSHARILRAAVRRDRRGAPRSSGRGHRRQDQLRRVRDGLLERDVRVRSRAQPLGARSHSRGHQRRFGRRRGGPTRATRARIGHGRIDPAAGSALRSRRPQTHVWPRVAIRTDRACLVAGSGRPHDPDRPRRGHRAARPGRRRCGRCHERARTGPRLRSRADGRHPRNSGRRPSPAPRSRRRRRGVARPRGGVRRADGAGRHAGGRRAAARPLRDSGLLPRVDGRGQLESGALRRRPLRVPLESGTRNAAPGASQHVRAARERKGLVPR